MRESSDELSASFAWLKKDPAATSGMTASIDAEPAGEGVAGFFKSMAASFSGNGAAEAADTKPLEAAAKKKFQNAIGVFQAVLKDVEGESPYIAGDLGHHLREELGNRFFRVHSLSLTN